MGGRCGVEVACFALFDRQELEARSVSEVASVAVRSRAAFFMSLYSQHWVLFGISVRIMAALQFRVSTVFIVEYWVGQENVGKI